MKKYAVSMLMAFLTTFCVLGVDLKDITSYKCGDSEDVVKYDFKSIGDYIKTEYYSNYDIESINIVENNKFLIDSCENFNQAQLNEYYNMYYAESGQPVKGTCAVVATLGAVAFYNTYDHNNYIDYEYAHYDARYQRLREFYSDILTGSLNKGYTTKTNGTANDKLNNVLSYGYDLSGSNRYGNTEWYHIKKKLNKSLNNKVPEMYALKDHAVVACGYTTFNYTIKYRKNNTLKTLTATKEAYIVNEGWGRLSRSVVFKDKVGNILDGHLLVISSKK